MDLKTRKFIVIEKIMLLDENEMGELEQVLDGILGEEVSLEQYNKDIEEADAAIDRGEYIEHKAAIKKLRSWRSK
jgi:predicted transcriptional regulator